MGQPVSEKRADDPMWVTFWRVGSDDPFMKDKRATAAQVGRWLDTLRAGVGVLEIPGEGATTFLPVTAVTTLRVRSTPPAGDSYATRV